MAKINVKYDTKTKELSVTQDGVSLANVDYISISKRPTYMDDDEMTEVYGLHISMCDDSAEKSEGLRQHHSLQANEQGEVVERQDILADNKKFFEQFLKRK